MIKFIAEIGSNHNGDPLRAIDLIEVAAHIGCAGVKFQLFEIEKLYHPSVLNNEKYSFLKERRTWELPVRWLPELINRTHSLGMLFGCTPFSLDAVEILSQFDIDFYKISSYDILNHRLIDAIAKKGRPIILSIGLANKDEVRQALGRLSSPHDLYVLYCVSNYPTSASKVNLERIEQIIPHNITNIGLSDHSANPGVIFRAIYSYFCSLIEFHLDLGDKRGFEYGPHCWVPQEIGQVIKWVNDGFKADGPETEDLSNELNWRASPNDGLRPLEVVRDAI
ncbi:MAG: N-acetylneuraminate synthase family protein [Candidatus Thorarchaeota archaeon]|jgi:N-acetylneuraminate synthase